MRLIFACLALIVPVSSLSATTALYRCSDGTVVRAAFSFPGANGSVRLAFAGLGQVVTLPQVLSADGGKYVGHDMEFWIKGTTARLTRFNATADCKQQ